MLHNLVQTGIDDGVIKPLSKITFAANQIEQAFRLLGSAKHIGKVLIKIRDQDHDLESLPISVYPRLYCKPELSYVIAGGLGGFGMELADWLVVRGCQKLLLNSRRGVTTAYQEYRIK